MDDREASGRSLETPTAGGVRRWYRGDLHVHSTLSNGGELTRQQLALAARARLPDFIATTEHNTTPSRDAWSSDVTGDLLVILGQEVVTPAGHWLALGIPPGHLVEWRYGLDDKRLAEQVHRVHHAGGVCIAAHPRAAYPSASFHHTYTGFDAVEVWNGPWASDKPWSADNESAVADWGRSLAADIPTGRWRPAIGNSDTHLDGQIGVPHTVVAADGLSEDSILGAIADGHSWIAETAAITLSFSVSAGTRRADIGERLVTGDEVVAQVDVSGVSLWDGQLPHGQWDCPRSAVAS
jgi:hypothetical protein